MADEFVYPKYLLVNGAGRDLLLRRRFSESERLCWFVGVLSIASASPIRGWLFIAPNEPATPDDIAEEAGVSVKTARSALDKLKRYGMVEHDETVHCDFVPNFDVHNPAPKKDPTNAVRQQRYRDRQNALLSNGSVTPSNALRNGAVVTPITGTSRSRSKTSRTTSSEVQVLTASSLQSESQRISLQGVVVAPESEAA